MVHWLWHLFAVPRDPGSKPGGVKNSFTKEKKFNNRRRRKIIISALLVLICAKQRVKKSHTHTHTHWCTVYPQICGSILFVKTNYQNENTSQ